MDSGLSVENAKIDVKDSIDLLKDSLNNYKNAKVNYYRSKISSLGSKVKTLGTNVVTAFQNLENEYYIYQYDLQIARMEQEREKAIKRSEKLEDENRKRRTAEHKKGMKAILKQQDREKRRQKVLNLKNGVICKTNSAKSAIGKVSNTLLNRTIRSKNLDLKIQNGLSRLVNKTIDTTTKRVQKGLNFKKGVVQKAKTFKSKVCSIPSTILNKVREKKIEKDIEKFIRMVERDQLLREKAMLKQQRENQLQDLTNTMADFINIQPVEPDVELGRSRAM